MIRTVPWQIPLGGISWRVRPHLVPLIRRSFPMTAPPHRLLPLASTDCGCCAPAKPSETVSAPPVVSDGATPEPATHYQVS